MEVLQDRDWRRLVETIRRGSCVLVLGSDIACDPDQSASLPLSSLFAEQLALKLEHSVCDPHDLPLVASAYLYGSKSDRLDLEIEAQDFYAKFEGKTTDAHRALAELPFTLCLTATPDNFMTEAFQQQDGKTPNALYYDISAPGRRSAHPPGRVESPVIYGLFGNAQVGPSLVLSECELLEFLVTVGRGSTALPDSIAAQLADPKTSFLFLGFGFQRWYTRVLLHVLKTHGHKTRSLAIEGESFFTHPERERTTLFFEQSSSIVFYREDWPAFATELRNRYRALMPQTPVPPLVDLSDAPTVFLCHDSRDGDLVAYLGQRLNELRINTWRDAQDLRGGLDWDRHIKRVLKRQVDYVVVCETPNMLSKGQSYFHKEIDIALEHQREFPNNQGFVWPVTLEPNDKFEQLDRLHRVDITTDAGIKRLAQELLENWHSKNDQRSNAK